MLVFEVPKLFVLDLKITFVGISKSLICVYIYIYIVFLSNLPASSRDKSRAFPFLRLLPWEYKLSHLLNTPIAWKRFPSSTDSCFLQGARRVVTNLVSPCALPSETQSVVLLASNKLRFPVLIFLFASERQHVFIIVLPDLFSEMLPQCTRHAMISNPKCMHATS